MSNREIGRDNGRVENRDKGRYGAARGFGTHAAAIESCKGIDRIATAMFLRLPRPITGLRDIAGHRHFASISVGARLLLHPRCLANLHRASC